MKARGLISDLESSVSYLETIHSLIDLEIGVGLSFEVLGIKVDERLVEVD